MKKEVSYNTIKGELLERLVRIRKKTELNQEEFYKKHLSALGLANLHKGSSIQNWMKNLENGNKDITPAILMRYAEIAGCTIDELIYGKEQRSVHEKVKEGLSVRDVCRMIVDIDRNFFVCVSRNDVDLTESDVAYINKDKYNDDYVKYNEKIPCYAMGFSPHIYIKDWSTPIYAYRQINLFLDRYFKLKEIHNMPEDLCQRIIESYLQEVDDTPVPHKNVDDSDLGFGIDDEKLTSEIFNWND